MIGSRIILHRALVIALLAVMGCDGDERLSPEPAEPASLAEAKRSSGGRTFFSATAENGSMSPWSAAISDRANPRPTISQSRTRNGHGAYKFEIANAQVASHYSQALSYAPQVSMGSRNGRYLSGYYSFWAYIDDGYSDNDWNMLLGWMTGVTGRPSPISHVGLEVWNGTLQLVYVLKNCSVRLYRCPEIRGYKNSGGWYTMTPSSPAGVVAFPRNRWVHLSFYYKMAPTNGQVKVWQDGRLIMDLTAPTMNTFGGHSIEPLRNSAGDMMLQFGTYGGAKSDGTQRFYVDDFKVTDFRPTQ
jgi:hypothetical protein